MDSRHSERARAFCALHERQGAFVMPNPWDVGTARILTALGFEALATTSAGLAFSLGRRDGEGAVSRDEALAHARVIVGATPLPVSADLENGFGDAPEIAAETIRLAADTGLAGASIEDTTGDPNRPIYDPSLAAERIAAAAEAAERSLSRSRSPRAPRISCMAAPISTTPSAGCRRSRPRARTCSTRPVCAIWHDPHGVRGGRQARERDHGSVGRRVLGRSAGRRRRAPDQPRLGALARRARRLPARRPRGQGARHVQLRR